MALKNFSYVETNLIQNSKYKNSILIINVDNISGFQVDPYKKCTWPMFHGRYIKILVQKRRDFLSRQFFWI